MVGIYNSPPSRECNILVFLKGLNWDFWENFWVKAKTLENSKDPRVINPNSLGI